MSMTDDRERCLVWLHKNMPPKNRQKTIKKNTHQIEWKIKLFHGDPQMVGKCVWECLATVNIFPEKIRRGCMDGTYWIDPIHFCKCIKHLRSQVEMQWNGVWNVFQYFTMFNMFHLLIRNGSVSEYTRSTSGSMAHVAGNQWKYRQGRTYNKRRSWSYTKHTSFYIRNIPQHWKYVRRYNRIFMGRQCVTCFPASYYPVRAVAVCIFYLLIKKEELEQTNKKKNETVREHKRRRNKTFVLN